MAEYPAFPVWTDALMADCGHLDDAEFGRYLLILITMWRSPGRRLPNDPAWFSKRFRRSLQDVENQLFPIMREFCQCDGNWWTQKRLEAEWQYVSKRVTQRRDAAKARWQKEKDTSKRNTNTYAVRNAPTPTPTPTPIDDHRVSSRSPSGTRLAPDWKPTEKDRDYAAALGLAPDDIETEFRDYWIAKAGAAARKADWSATWRTWCRKSAERLSAPGGRRQGGGVGSNLFEAGQMAANDLKRRRGF